MMYDCKLQKHIKTGGIIYNEWNEKTSKKVYKIEQ
jgi:hypothetical protein